MQGAIRIDVGELPQSVGRVVRRMKVAAEVFHRLPLRVDRVGITDIEVDTGRGAQRVMVGPLGEMDRHLPSVDESVPVGTFVGSSGEAQRAIPGQRRI